ncbi:hypothetical protein BHE74_00014640 [Ensete ventricosum]|nr:hypothetical protein BHE74_00014640 [Ensete ventricosum]
MADALSLIPASVLRNLADKLYEKRKNAALEVFWWVDRTGSGNCRLKHSYTGPDFQQIVPPVLNSFADQDSRVRYYACEALYNIAKVSRSAFDQFSIEEFIPLLRERMNVLNPYVRQFLVGWITVLDSVPDIDMLGFLPDFLDGNISEKRKENVDYGRMAEILVQRAGSSDEFTRLTAITWVKLITFSTFLMVARETNEELRAIRADPADGFDIDAILSIARRCIF